MQDSSGRQLRCDTGISRHAFVPSTIFILDGGQGMIVGLYAALLILHGILVRF